MIKKLVMFIGLVLMVGCKAENNREDIGQFDIEAIRKEVARIEDSVANEPSEPLNIYEHIFYEIENDFDEIIKQYEIDKNKQKKLYINLNEDDIEDLRYECEKLKLQINYENIKLKQKLKKLKELENLNVK